MMGIALWQAALDMPGLVPCDLLIQKRGKEKNNPLHVEQAKPWLGNISQAGGQLWQVASGLSSSPAPSLTCFLN